MPFVGFNLFMHIYRRRPPILIAQFFEAPGWAMSLSVLSKVKYPLRTTSKTWYFVLMFCDRYEKRCAERIAATWIRSMYTWRFSVNEWWSAVRVLRWNQCLAGTVRYYDYIVGMGIHQCDTLPNVDNASILRGRCWEERRKAHVLQDRGRAKPGGESERRRDGKRRRRGKEWESMRRKNTHTMAWLLACLPA